MQVILSVFCLSSENYLCICVCICNLFLEGGTKSKKKIDILEKWRGGKKKETKCGFNKRSITPPYWHSDRVNYNQIDRLLKDIQADKAQRVSSSQTTSLLKLQSCTDQDNALVLFIARVAWLPSGRSCEAEHTLDGEQGSSHGTLHIAYFAILFSAQSAQPGALATCSLHISYYSIVLHCLL